MTLAPIEQRHAIYQIVLDFFQLSIKHRTFLINTMRTSSDTLNGYGSYNPEIHTPEELTSFSHALIETGYSLEGVPGFYRLPPEEVIERPCLLKQPCPDDPRVTRLVPGGFWRGEWSMSFYGEGILMPYLTESGLIRGFRVRRDSVTEGQERFYWLTSEQSTPHLQAVAG